jgi:hypothetical protein
VEELLDQVHYDFAHILLWCLDLCSKLTSWCSDVDSYFAKQDVVTDVHELEHFMEDHSDQVSPLCFRRFITNFSACVPRNRVVIISPDLLLAVNAQLARDALPCESDARLKLQVKPRRVCNSNGQRIVCLPHSS